MNMRKTMALVGCAVLAVGVSYALRARASMASNPGEVTVDDGSHVFSGAPAIIYRANLNTSQVPKQYISCKVETIAASNTPKVICEAATTNATAVARCESTNQNIVAAARSINDSSFVEVYFNPLVSPVTCYRIFVTQGSQWM